MRSFKEVFMIRKLITTQYLFPLSFVIIIFFIMVVDTSRFINAINVNFAFFFSYPATERDLFGTSVFFFEFVNVS